MRPLRLTMLFVFLAASAWAQPSATDKAAAADPADEWGEIAKNCPVTSVVGCASVLFTGQPLHVAVGNLAPQNGFAGGLAYVGRTNPTSGNWRISWNADAVVSPNQSWRAGGYVKFVDTRLKPSTVRFGRPSVRTSDTAAVERPVFGLYMQTTSLNKLAMFGLGAGTTEAGRSYFGMTNTVVGANVVRPVGGAANLAVYGEANGRIIRARSSAGQESPSIEQLYTALSAPGLGSQSSFLQLGVGLRVRPSLFNDHVRLSYDASIRPYIATSGTGFSFERLTIDLAHEIPLYRTQRRWPQETNGPNDCTVDLAAQPPRCAAPGILTTREGAITLRAFVSTSLTPGHNVVPFYLQPTVGGSDVNGDGVLSSYQDYRFRAPNLLVFREKIEHSLGRLPIGVTIMADQVRVALTSGGLGSGPWVHGYAAGLTVRAGGFPVLSLLYAFGGAEGSHTVVNLSDTLLGASGRPSLF